jgi:hypothetical protein
MSRRIALPGAAAVVLATLLASCDRPPAAPPAAPTESALRPTPGVPWFEDVTAAAGIDFFHYDSVTPLQTILETMGGGVAWIDYDGDGWLDLFCVQDGPLRPTNHVGPLPTHKFYRNNGDGTFADVTERVGLNKTGYGMGCAVGDFNNDGYDDLVVTYYRGVTLFENRPDGSGGRRFADVTRAAKIDDPHWATSCGWGDIDGDGRLDLYMCNYVEVNLDDYKPCVNEKAGENFICPPTIFPKTAHRLYRNNGDGTFADVTQSSGIGSAPPGGGLAVVLLDLDGDGKTDIYVANDLGQAYLFQNLGGGKFTDRGMLSGAVIDANGRFMAGMGIAAGDLDGSHRPSLVVTNYQDEPDMVFLNQGKMRFREWSHPSGIGPATMRRLAFGIDLLDADLDGNLDVAIANGHVYRNAQSIYGYRQAQEQQLFLGDGAGRFRDVSHLAGPYFREIWIGRGLAVCDYDNDGRPDLMFGNNSGPAKLLRNATRTDHHWLRLELVGDGKASNRNAVGARVEVEAGGRKLVRWVHGGGSYLSASDRRLLVGLGAAKEPVNVTVVWPSGAKQEFRGVEADRGWRLTQGQPTPAPLPAGTGRGGGKR